MTYREIVYMTLDEIKSVSDDAFFTEEHIIFLAGKWRAFLLKQRYSDIKKQIPESNYQTICLDLMEVPAIAGEPCEGGVYLKSTIKIPFMMKLGNPSVFPMDYYSGDIALISRDRMRYVGHNKYLQNIIYASIGPDNYLYFKSYNPQFLYLEKVKMSGIFENPEIAAGLQCNEEGANCDVLDLEFPIEESLVPPLLELLVKELLGAEYRPEDNVNNAKDDLGDLASYAAKNTKSNLAK